LIRCPISISASQFSVVSSRPIPKSFVESCHSRVRDELLDVEEFSCLAEARVVINDWREDYSLRRPHSALGMRTPAAFTAEWTTTSELPAAA
jgi:putative transposase